MKKFMEKFEAIMVPIGTKLAENKYLKVINQAFMIILPLTIFGSIFTLIGSFPVTAWTSWLASTGLSSWINFPATLTVNLIALYTVIAVGYSYAKNEKVDPISGALTALLAFLIVTPFAKITTNMDTVVSTLDMSWFGARGLFVALIVGILSTKMFVYFIKKGLVIKMPEGVPPMVSQSFSALIPMFIACTTFLVVGFGMSFTSFGSLHSLIYTFIARPLQSVGGSLGGAIIFAVALHTLWFFGLHGGNIVNSISNTFLLPLALENLATYQAGGTPEFIYTTAFKNTYNFGGAGMTISLCILMIFVAKSQRYKALGKLAAPANIFYINEPIIFGTPMVLNVTMFIPFLLAPITTILMAYGLTKIGILPVLIGYQIPWSMPPIVSGFIQGGWRVAAFQVFCLLTTLAIYYPFFKIIDKQAVIEENGSDGELMDKSPVIDNA